jgi:hypothetical protein
MRTSTPHHVYGRSPRILSGFRLVAPRGYNVNSLSVGARINPDFQFTLVVGGTMCPRTRS